MSRMLQKEIDETKPKLDAGKDGFYVVMSLFYVIICYLILDT